MVNRRLPARWLLLAVVAFALMVMHHLPAGHGSDPAAGHGAAPMAAVVAMEPVVTAHPASDAGGMSGMLHECLALAGQLAAGAVLLLLIVSLTRLAGVPRVPVLSVGGRKPDRPPGSGGRTILNSVCVLRL